MGAAVQSTDTKVGRVLRELVCEFHKKSRFNCVSLPQITNPIQYSPRQCSRRRRRRRCSRTTYERDSKISDDPEHFYGELLRDSFKSPCELETRRGISCLPTEYLSNRTDILFTYTISI